MQVDTLIESLVKHSGMSFNAVSAALGRSREYARNVSKAAAPRVDTLADVADVAGVDVVLVDRSTGSIIGTIEPPRRAAQGD